MAMKTLIIAVVSILLSVAAQFSLKAGMSSSGIKAAMSQPYTLRTIVDILTDRYVFLGFFLYGLGAVIWLGVLSKWDVSKAYPIVGLGFAFTAAVGFMIGEQVTLLRLFGIALICAGVFLVSQS
jgi:multidrug transporter EmrE-like cation transporter